MAHWVRVADLAECPPGSSREVVAAGRVVALFNVEGEIFALDGVCSHQGGPLGSGCLEGHVVTCPWHGWQYDIRDGQHQFSASVKQPRFDVRVDGDAILVDVDT